jgi:hypothetical protein
VFLDVFCCVGHIPRSFVNFLSFFVNVSLGLVFHKNVTLYTFTGINLHSSVAFSFTTDNILPFIYN